VSLRDNRIGWRLDVDRLAKDALMAQYLTKSPRYADCATQEVVYPTILSSQLIRLSYRRLEDSLAIPVNQF
jgi:hypothetical protein